MSDFCAWSFYQMLEKSLQVKEKVNLPLKRQKKNRVFEQREREHLGKSIKTAIYVVELVSNVLPSIAGGIFKARSAQPNQLHVELEIKS